MFTTVFGRFFLSILGWVPFLIYWKASLKSRSFDSDMKHLPCSSSYKLSLTLSRYLASIAEAPSGFMTPKFSVREISIGSSRREGALTICERL